MSAQQSNAEMANREFEQYRERWVAIKEESDKQLRELQEELDDTHRHLDDLVTEGRTASSVQNMNGHLQAEIRTISEQHDLLKSEHEQNKRELHKSKLQISELNSQLSKSERQKSRINELERQLTTDIHSVTQHYIDFEDEIKRQYVKAHRQRAACLQCDIKAMDARVQYHDLKLPESKTLNLAYREMKNRTKGLQTIFDRLKDQKVQKNNAKTAKWTKEYLKLKKAFQEWKGHKITNPVGIQREIDKAQNFENHFATLDACAEYVDIEQHHMEDLALYQGKAKDFLTDLQVKRNAQIEEETKKRNENLIKLEKEASTSQAEILRVRDDFKSREEEAAKDSNRCQKELTEKKEQLTALQNIAIHNLQPLFEAARKHIKEDRTVEIVENVENSLQMTWKDAVSIMNNMRSVECTASIFAASFTAAGSDESAATFTTLSKEAKGIKDILEKALNNADLSPSQKIKRLSAENGRLENFKTEVITLFKELDKKLNEFMQNTTHDSSIRIAEHNIKQYMNRMKEIQSVALSSERLTDMRQFLFTFTAYAVKKDFISRATKAAGSIQSRIEEYMSKQARTLKELQEQVEDATRAKEQIQAKLSEAKARCKDAVNRERSSEQKLTSVEGELAALRQEEEAKQAALQATFENAKTQLQAKLEAAETACQDGEQKHEQLKGELAKMKQISEEAVARAAVNAAAKDELKQVEAQLQAAQSEALSHKGATDQLRSANASLKQSKDAKIEELQAAFEVTKTRIQAELTSVQAELAASKRRAKDQNEALDKAVKDKKELEAELSAAQTECEHKKQNLQELTHTLGTIKQQLRVANAQGRDQTTAAKNKTEELEAKLKAAETACQAESDYLQKANAALKQRKEELKLKLKSAEFNLAKLKQQTDHKIKKLQATFGDEKERIEAELRVAQNELKQLQSKHAEFHEQYKAGTTKLTSAEEELASLRKLNEENLVKNESKAESKLAEMATTIEGFKNDLSKQKTIIDGNAKLIADRESQLETEFDKIKQELIDKHKAQLLQLNTEHESERRDNFKEIEKLEVINHDLIRTLDEQLRELERRQRNSKRQEKDLGNVNKEKGALDKLQALVLDEKQKEIKQLDSQVRAAQESIRQLKLQLQENEKKLAEEQNSQQAELEHFKQHTLASAEKFVDDQNKKHAEILTKIEDELSTTKALNRTLVIETKLLQAKNKKDTAAIEELETEVSKKRGQFIAMSSTLQQKEKTHKGELSRKNDQMQKRQDSLHSQMKSEKEDMKRRHEADLAQQTRNLEKKDRVSQS